MNVIYAISSAAFAVLFLGAVIVYGDTAARNIAIGAAFLACGSQFMAQDPSSYRASIYSAYAAFVVALLAYVYLLLGS